MNKKVTLCVGNNSTHMDLGPSYRSRAVLRIRFIHTGQITLTPPPILVLFTKKEFLGIFEAWRVQGLSSCFQSCNKDVKQYR